ncbi:electron transfer flavoprotein subunit beta/FixA family protein [Photobacterium nomapromontoriensis]|uniref:electron transfer flavoprotein subunit beta/FixA family protein n=1 Tax=Photobacterium nomapromontoriensis TaxID=2910237 RepID=UPI003D105ED5
MKVLVAIKRVIDPYVKIRVKADGSGVEKSNVKMTINPFCEIAVEEAIRLREAGYADEVVVVSAGDSQCQEQLRTALALGADRAIHIDSPSELEPLTVAKLLQAVMTSEMPQLVLLGKQSIDTDNNQVAQMLSALTQYPQGTFVSKLAFDGEERDGVTVTREIDAGLETLRLSLPAIISTDLRLNTPRYASLPNIMKAKSKPLDVVTPDALGVEIHQHQMILDVFTPPERQSGVRVHSVEELVDKLKNNEKVI